MSVSASHDPSRPRRTSAPGLLVERDEVLEVRLHLGARLARVTGLDRLHDPVVVAVDLDVEAPAELRAREVSLQGREDRLRRDVEQRVAAALDQRRVELRVVEELLARVHPRRVGRDGRAQALEVVLAAPLGGEPGRRHFEQDAGLDQLLEGQVPVPGQQVDVRPQEVRDVADRRDRDVAAAPRALRRAQQVLGREHAQGLPDRRPADAELAREQRLVGQPLAG